MDMLNVHEAKTHFSKVLDRVEAGETVLLSRRNKVIAEIRPVPGERPKGKRPLGLMKGRVHVPDSFFDPLPDDLLRKMLGED